MIQDHILEIIALIIASFSYQIRVGHLPDGSNVLGVFFDTKFSVWLCLLSPADLIVLHATTLACTADINVLYRAASVVSYNHSRQVSVRRFEIQRGQAG